MEKGSPTRGSAFPPTQWTVIVDAVSSNPDRAREALERLCATYRQPIVNWFRRKDYQGAPEDLAHDFVTYLLEKNLLNKVALRTGKFRSFLATSMQFFLRDSWDKQGALKRGGNIEKVPLTESDVEVQSESSGDNQLDIDFALTVHRKVLAQLAPQEELKPYLFRKDSNEGWDAIATRLKKTASALRKEVSRLKHRHLEQFQDEVAQIVAPTDRAEETRYLYELLLRNQPPD